MTKHHLFACRPALKCEFMHWIWFEVQFFLLTSAFATAFRGNSNRRLQSAHNKAASLCWRPSNCHVTRKRESSWTSRGRQASKRMREAAVDAHFTFTSYFFLCWPFLFSQLLLAPLLEIIVKFKVKAYASLHNDLYLKTDKICHKFCKKRINIREKQDVTIFTFFKT